LYLIFAFHFFKVGKFAAFIKRPKATRVSASGELRPLTLWPGALPLETAGVSASKPPL